MKKIVYYICEICLRSFNNKADAIICELNCNKPEIVYSDDNFTYWDEYGREMNIENNE